MNAPARNSLHRAQIFTPWPRPVSSPIHLTGELTRYWSLIYRSPLDLVARQLPPQLKPVSFGGFGFWNVAIFEIAGLRPRGLPKNLGITARFAAYRLHVRHQNKAGASVEGLHFQRCDCCDGDSPILTGASNLLSGFGVHHHRGGDIEIAENPLATRLEVKAAGANGHATIHYGHHAKLAHGSPFHSVQEAGDFLRFAPNALSVNRRGRVQVVTVRRDESAWKPRVVAASSDRWEVLTNAKAQAKLEIAFEVAPIALEWLPAREL